MKIRGVIVRGIRRIMVLDTNGVMIDVVVKK